MYKLYMYLYLQLNYISIVSNYIFDNSNMYYLVITHTDNTYIYINKILLSNINNNIDNNIKNNIKSYAINKIIKINSSIFGIHVNIKLYSQNKSGEINLLMTTNNMNLQNYEHTNKSIIHMRAPVFIDNKMRSLVYQNDNDYINELLFNIESYDKDLGYCLLFFVITSDVYSNINSIKNLVNSTIIKYTDLNKNNKNIYIYNRYDKMIIIEYINNNLLNNHSSIYEKHKYNIQQFKNKYCHNNDKKIYNNYNKDYKVDKYVHNIFNINIKYRQIKYDRYANNLIYAPLDGRYIGFDINNKININGHNINIKDYININYTDDTIDNVGNGSGYYIRVAPQDYHGLFVPYAGYLRNIIKTDNYMHITIFTDYYISPDTHERDYLSVINGNFTHGGGGVGAGNRHYQDILNLQNNDDLLYNIIVLGSNIIIKSPKILYFLENIKNNIYDKKIWLSLGEDILDILCGDGIVLILFNRIIDFSQDINYYSMYNIETYTKGRDLIGYLH